MREVAAGVDDDDGDARVAARDAPRTAERTVFAPEDCPAVLLFSDGRFDLPDFAPRTFAVIDPALDAVASPAS